jgi:hypothetical protein
MAMFRAFITMGAKPIRPGIDASRVHKPSLAEGSPSGAHQVSDDDIPRSGLSTPRRRSMLVI